MSRSATPRTREEEGVSPSEVAVSIGDNEIAPMREPAAEKPKAEPTAAPLEHAFATGNARLIQGVVAFGRPGERPTPGQELEVTWQHAAAEQLHHWKDHAHHDGQPIQLTRADYLAALAAAANHDAKPAPTPHKPALSPHAPAHVRALCR